VYASDRTQPQVSPLRSASVEMTDLWWVALLCCAFVEMMSLWRVRSVRGKADLSALLRDDKFRGVGMFVRSVVV